MPPISRRRFIRYAGGIAALAAGSRPLRALAGVIPEGRWFAGDLHVHTTYSHDVWGGPSDDNTGPDEAYTLGWSVAEQIAIAELRGLEFLALTDHNDVRALSDPGYVSQRLTLLPGYEHSLAGGHAGVFGIAEVLRDSTGSRSFPDVREFVDLVHARGGMTVLNHPFYGNEEETPDKVSWGYPVDDSRGFDAIEVWNIGWPARQDTIRFADSDNYFSLQWWEDRFLGGGTRMPLVGGSDNHWRSTTAVQGAGQPTTWVFAADRSAAAILDALRAGRTFVAAEPPGLGGPMLLLDVNGAIPGGTATGPLDVSVRAVRGQATILRVVAGTIGGTGVVVHEQPLLLPDQTVALALGALPQDGWVRAELYVDRSYFMYAITGAVWVAGSSGASGIRGAPRVYGHPTRRKLPLL